MSLLKTFTQGGQVTLHNLRMIRQVMGVTLGATCLTGILFFGIICWIMPTPYQRNLAFSYMVARLKVNIVGQDRSKQMQNYTNPNGINQRVHSLDQLCR